MNKRWGGWFRGKICGNLFSNQVRVLADPTREGESEMSEELEQGVYEVVFCQKCGSGRRCEVTERSEYAGKVRLLAECPACGSPHERVVSHSGLFALGATSILAHRLMVYIAGPFSADTAEGVLLNVDRAIETGIAVKELGHHPHVPHLTYYLDQAGLDLSHAGWLTFNRPWLMNCDAILVLAASPGADQERKWAEKEGLIVYDELESVPSAEYIAREGTFHVKERAK